MATYKEQLKNISSALSQNPAVQAALANIDVGVVITQIGDKYDLTLEEIGHLYDVVGQVLTGEIKAAAFTENIKNKIDSFNWKHLDDLVNDLNREIFVKVREAMRVGTQPTAPTPPPKTATGALWPPVNTSNIQPSRPANLPTEETEQENYATQKELLEQIENPHTIPASQAPNSKSPNFAEATSGKQVPLQPVQGSELNRETNKFQATKEEKPDTTNYKPQTINSPAAFSFTPPAKTRPESDSSIPPVPKPVVPEKPSIVGDRLTKTVVAPKEQTTYKVDPYREPPK